MFDKLNAFFGYVKDKVKAIAGNSRTIGVAYAVEFLALLDEAKVLDWSSLFGVEKGGRIAAILGVVIFALRFVTKGPVSFRSN